MKIVIVGCGRVGASAAEHWDAAGHEVVILDIETRAFERLPSAFQGTAIRGDGTDEDVLRRAGAEGADVLLALTEGDNRNIMAAQLAVEALDDRAASWPRSTTRCGPTAYAELGIATLCRTGLMLDAMNAHLGCPPSGLAGMLAASGHTSRRRPRARRASAEPVADRAAARPWRPEPCSSSSSAVARSATTWPRNSSTRATRWPSWRRTRGGPRQIADEVGSIVIAHDGCEGKYLAEAGCNRADVVAAVTGDDEDNLVICQMAKHHFDVPRTIARVNNPANEPLFRHLGVDELISPTRMILGSIEQDIPVHELLHLAALGEGELEIIEAHLQPGSPAIGRAPRDLDIPDGCSLFAVIRDGVATPLRPESVLREGDKVIAIGKPECEEHAPRAAHRRPGGAPRAGWIRRSAGPARPRRSSTIDRI